MSVNHKVPPPFKKGEDFELWKKKLKIWQSVTPIEPKKQAGTIFLSLDDEAQTAILELDETLLSSDEGVTNVLNRLNTLYQKDRTQSAFEALEEFEALKRKDGTLIKDFCNQFELAYNKAKQYGTQLSTDVLAFRLLKSANLRDEQVELVKATVGQLNFDNMKAHLKKIHVNVGSNSSAEYGAGALKSEFETFYTEQDCMLQPQIEPEEEDTYSSQQRYGPSLPVEEENFFTQQRRRPNIPDEFGKPTKCSFCHSIYHYVSRCPDAPRPQTQTRQRGGPSTSIGSYSRGRPSYPRNTRVNYGYSPEKRL